MANIIEIPDEFLEDGEYLPSVTEIRKELGYINRRLENLEREHRIKTPDRRSDES